jgi:hypothetical protein
MLRTFPPVTDPASPESRHVHIRSTMWGCGWPVDAPALCGTRPRSHWCIVNAQATCEECMALLPPRRAGSKTA